MEYASSRLASNQAKSNLNFNDARSESSNEAQIISEDELDSERILNFYFISNKFEYDWKYELEIRSPCADNKPQRISMDRRGEQIFHLQVKMSQRQLDFAGELRYAFIRIEQDRQDQSGDGNSREIEHEKTKGKKFLHLNTFFDFLNPKRNIMAAIGKNEQLYQAIQYFIQSYDKRHEYHQGKLELYHFGKPEIFKELIEFCQIEGMSFPYSHTLKILHQEYTSKQFDKDFNIYLLQLISSFDNQRVVVKKKQKFLTIISEIMKLPIGFMRELLDNDSLTQEQTISLCKGLNNIFTVQPVLSLEFLDKRFLKDSKMALLKEINMKDESYVGRMINFIKIAQQSLKFGPIDLQIIITHLLLNTKNLSVYLEQLIELKAYVHPDTITKTINELKKRFGGEEFKKFVRNRAQDLVSFSEMKYVLRSDLKGHYLKQLRSQPTIQDHTNVFLVHPDLLSLKYMESLVSIDTNQYLQLQFKELVRLFVQTDKHPEQIDIAKLNIIVASNFYNLIKNLKNIVHQFQVMSDYIDLLNDQAFKNLHAFKLEVTLSFFTKHLENMNSQLDFKKLLIDLVYIQEKYSNYQDKVDQIITVIQRIMKRNGLDAIMINHIFCLLFKDDLLISQYFKDIVDYALNRFKDLMKLKPDSRDWLTIFTNDQVFKAFLISKNYKHETLDLLRDQVQQFINKMVDKSLTLKHIDLIIARKCQYLDRIIHLVDPQFDDQIFQKLITIQEDFKYKVDKYLNYIIWASKFYTDVNINQKRKLIQIAQENLDFKTAADAESNDGWKDFSGFKTVDKFYSFKYSKLFENIFNTLENELETLKFEFSQWKPLADGRKQIELAAFDAISDEYLFKGLCQAHFNSLISYPGVGISVQILNKYWLNIKAENVQRELEIVFKSSKQLVPQIVIDDLIKFGQLEDYKHKTNILLKIEHFAAKCLSFRSENDEMLVKLKEFNKFAKKVNDSTQLEQISGQVTLLERIYNEILQNKKIEWDFIVDLSKSQELFNFCVQNVGLDFNDLYEFLEGYTFLNNDIIVSMNAVSKFFTQLSVDLCSKEWEYVSLDKLMQSLSSSFVKEVVGDTDFRKKLSNCNQNLLAIKQISDSSKNVSENALQIITDCLEKGNVIWSEKDDHFEFGIEITYKHNDLEMKVYYDQDKVTQHQSRALLMIHSKKFNPDNQIFVEDSVNKFGKAVLMMHQINQYLRDLQGYGRNHYKTLQKKLAIHPDSIIADLKKFLEKKQNQLEVWKSLLSGMRNQYYFLNYVPNRLVAKLLQPDSEKCYDSIVQKFMKYKILNEQKIDMEKLKPNPYQALQDIWMNDQKKQEDSLKINIDKKDLPFMLTQGKVQIKHVNDACQLFRCLLSLFACSQRLPTYFNILICTEETQSNEIEIFVMRAILYPKELTSPKLFVIVNFQKLLFEVQTFAYEFIKKIQDSYSNNPFLLYVLIVAPDIRQAHLIEELRGSQAFNSYLKPEIVESCIISKFDHIRFVTSSQCGFGKSFHINDQIRKKNHQTLRIPIQGELTRQKLIRLHKLRINQLEKDPNFEIHYDIYPTTKEDLNILLFEIIFLKSINSNSNKVLIIPETRIFFEVSQQIITDYSKYIFNDFNKKSIQLKLNYINIRVTQNKDDPFQKVSRYLNSVDSFIVQKLSRKDDSQDFKKEDYNPQILKEPNIPWSEMQCQLFIKKYLLDQIQNPNFYFISLYVNFVYDQIKRLEDSVFFSQAYLEEQMTGFFGFQARKKANKLHRTIVEQLIDLSYKISVVLAKKRQSESNSEALIPKTNLERLAERFKDDPFDVYNYPFIVFNDCGSITPIYKELELVPKPIQDYHKRINRRSKEAQIMKRYQDLTQDEYVEKILEICVDEGQKIKLKRSFELKNLVFTLDNFMKLVLIYLRIRCNQPIILMGETGVGKTSLVEYLSKIIDAEFLILNVHAGVTENDIITFVSQGIDLAKQQRKNEGQPRKIILFFDEINTNTNISGLFKEIMIDRHCNGQPLESNIRLVAACNPYQQRKKEITGYSAGLKLSDNELTYTKLVYRVLAMPDSMLPFVWDYKSLDSKEELQYIRKMVQKTFDLEGVMGSQIKLMHLWTGSRANQQQEREKLAHYENEVEIVSRIIQESHLYIKESEEAWAVSLRDVSRFCKIFVYFYKNNTRNDDRLQTRNTAQYIAYPNLGIALVLAIYFCYVVRINTQAERDKFIDILSQKEQFKQKEVLQRQRFKRIVFQEQSRFLSNMEIERDIGLSQTLMENIFVMITCILNKIPLLITGKPGSSKTLAMKLITQSFKGPLSKNKFFQQYPDLIQCYYQGSEQSTSSSILGQFNKAIAISQKIKDNQLVVVIFDEIGLAEKSQNNPLKILHSLLEPPQVAFVGISNWSLDASKMNRVITLSRYDPDQLDLTESAKSIAKDSSRIFQEKYVNDLVKWYLNYMIVQESKSKHKNFHGLRDFYAMIKSIAVQMTDFNEGEHDEIIINAIQRNFGGVNYELVLKTLLDCINLKTSSDRRAIKPDQLIKANLIDFNSRHLMIITDNYENTLQFIQDECQDQKKPYEIFYGSDFPDDQNEESLYNQINEIILQMESGTLCIFLNLDSIYQSFYDMLNQNYQIRGASKFCNVAIGPDKSLCMVNANFKCIIIVDENKLDKMDPPLLNRFEKQLFTDDFSVDYHQKQLITKLSQWPSLIAKVKIFDEKSMFPSIDDQFNQSLQQLVIQNRSLYGENDDQRIIEETKRSLMRVATFQGVMRCQESEANDREMWYREYVENKVHYSLESLVQHYFENWKQEICFKNSKGFNLIVYTYSAIMKKENQELKLPEYEQISLSNVSKKKYLIEKVQKFFKDSNPKKLLILNADQLTDKKIRINLCKSIINNLRTKKLIEYEDKKSKRDAQLAQIERGEIIPQNQLVQLVEPPEKHVCLIIKLHKSKDDDDQSISFGKDWRHYTIDLLNGQGQSEVSIEQIMKQKFETLISLACTSTNSNLFLSCLVEAMSKIYDNKPRSEKQEKIRQINDIFEKSSANNQYLKDLIQMKLMSLDTFENLNDTWKLQVVKSEFLMKSNLTFHSAALEYIKIELVKLLTFVIFYLEQDGILESHSEDENKNQVFEHSKAYFMNIFRNDYINKKFQDIYMLPPNYDRVSFPLARVIHKQFQQLKIQYMKILKEQSENIEESKNFQDQENDFVDVSDIMLESESDIRRHRSTKDMQSRKDLAKIRSYRKKDKYLINNINELHEWSRLYFPQEYIDQELLRLRNEEFLKDFSYLLDREDFARVLDKQKQYNQFLTFSLNLIMKEKILSKPQIYGVFWKYENLLQNVWKIVSEHSEIFGFEDIQKMIIAELTEHELYKFNELVYLPREVYVEAVINAFYKLYYPSQNMKASFKDWVSNVQQTFKKLNDLAFYYLKEINTEKSRIIIFLLKYYHEIYSTEQNEIIKKSKFINFADSIKNQFNKPKQLIQQILDEMQQTQDIKQKRKIYQFICRYVIDVFNENEDVEIDTLLNSVISCLFNEQASLQQEQSFKFILQKLVYMVVFYLEPDCSINCLISDRDEFQTQASNCQNFAYLDYFLSSKEGLKFRDPFVISLCDQLEEQISLDAVSDQDLIVEKLSEIKKILTNTKNYSALQTINAISVFKKICKLYLEEISFLMQGYDLETVQFNNGIQSFFQTNGLSKLKNDLTPFAYYLMKLLYEQFNLLTINKNQILEKNQWIKEYSNIDDSEEQIRLISIKEDTFNQLKQQCFQKLPTVEELQPKLTLEKQIINRYAQMLSIIDFYHFSNQQQAIQDPDWFLGQNVQLLQNKTVQAFLSPFVKRGLIPGRGDIIKINTTKDEKYYFKMVQIIVGSAALSCDQTFMYEFLANTVTMKESYIPFVQNFKDFYSFQTKVSVNKNIVVLKCNLCSNIQLSIDLNDQKKKLSQALRFGDYSCKKIDPRSGNEQCKGELKQKNVDVKDFLNNPNEMAKGYIPFETQSYNLVQVRGLSAQTLALGRIVLHSLLMVCLLFSQFENDILNAINGSPFQGRDYKFLFEKSFNYLKASFDQDWEYLKSYFNVNDEKVLQIVQYIVLQMLKEHKEFKAEKTSSPQGRQEMENKFSKICEEIFISPGDFFALKIGFDNPIEQILMECNPLRDQDSYHLLRVLGKINIQQFEHYLKLKPEEDNKFFSLIFEQKQSIQDIRYLKPLVNWAKYIMNSWSAELNYDEVTELSIRELIQKENRNNSKATDYMQKIERDFLKFKDAWNNFAGLIIRDKKPQTQTNEVVEVRIPEITDDSKMDICCITSDNTEQRGFIFYLLLKYLAKKQNHALGEAEKLFEKESQIHSIKFPHTSMLSLKKDAIIQFRESRQLKPKRKGTQEEQKNPDPLDLESQSQQEGGAPKMLEKEKFEQVIIVNSYCSLQYRNGKMVEYNMEMIKINSVDLLLKGKYKIDFSQSNARLNFQYVNMGNLYSQVAEIQQRIPQQPYENSKQIVMSVFSPYELYEVYQDFLTIMNFIFQSPEEPAYNLLQYFKQYNLHQRFLSLLDDDHFAQNIKLCHIIDFYNRLENRLYEMLIEKVNPNYMLEIEEKQLAYLEFILKEEAFLIKPLRKAVARLCIRLLQGEAAVLNPKKSIFQVLLCEDKSCQFIEADNIAVDTDIASIILSQSTVCLENAVSLFHFLTDLNFKYKQEIERLALIYDIKKSLTHQSEDGNQSSSQITIEAIQKISILGSDSSFISQVQQEEELKENFLRQSILESNTKIYEQFEEELAVEGKKKKFDPSRLLFEFFIIGPDTSQLSDSDLEKNKGEIELVAQIQYMFAEKKLKSADEKKLQVPQFCFPSGVPFKKANSIALNKYLGSLNYSFTKKNTFIFLIRTDEQDFDADQQQFYYCLCILKDDLVEKKVGKKKHYFLTQKAYCIMTLYKYFDFHLQVLNSIFSLYKIERLRLQSVLRNTIFSDFERDLEAAIRTPLVTDEITKLLDNYFKLKPKGNELNILQNQERQSVNYEIPRQQMQLEMNDLFWYAPMFLQVLKLDQFYQILIAILQETSIIFIADSLPMLSSAAIGIQCFLEPFQWPYPQIPILPRSLLDITASVTPFIVGIHRSYEEHIEDAQSQQSEAKTKQALQQNKQ